MLLPKKTISIFLFQLVILFSFAQETSSINEGTIEEQFNYLTKISSNYNSKGKTYEVVNRVYFEALKLHVLDSLKKLENNIMLSNKTITEQQEQLSKLEDELNTTKKTLDKTNIEKDKMFLFGIQLTKTSYNLLLWSIISVLFVLLIVFIYKFKSSNSVTRQAKKALEETEQEFEEHRRIALEREQKVRRQLQDEINKHKPNKK